MRHARGTMPFHHASCGCQKAILWIEASSRACDRSPAWRVSRNLICHLGGQALCRGRKTNFVFRHPAQSLWCHANDISRFLKLSKAGLLSHALELASIHSIAFWQAAWCMMKRAIVPLACAHLSKCTPRGNKGCLSTESRGDSRGISSLRRLFALKAPLTAAEESTLFRDTTKSVLDSKNPCGRSFAEKLVSSIFQPLFVMSFQGT